ncbi:FAD/NAD(P)-binding protein [Corynebacterium lizhenjunii]|uniref:FAD/NAD(P)-binding protein n=1 Tax=Corynebacterium lizhenjunii TaxID=2709394 RepID=A0A7T0PBN3_9CORY|nr:FAD/NAD(P)-binding protein [Corynebacterium lizhenjunii]QPK78692.1 FAD/NAD(P)-binding protein [Corynebacterium lizhenjunii]
MTTASIAIIGMGPRGISLIERLAAHLRAIPADAPAINLHLIDDAQHGAGRIWETTQTHTLCMNTLAGAVTLFTEPGSTMSAPVLEGPTQFEWIQLLRGERAGIAPAKVALFDSHPVAPEITQNFAAEIAATVPESNPSRALYGAYLEWAFAVSVAQLPASVRVTSHHCRAVAIHPGKDSDCIELADSSSVTAHATVLAAGWQVPGLTDSEQVLAQAVEQSATAQTPLHWVRPDNPVEQPLCAVPAGQKVLVRGLGMGFFDVMALLSSDRGGSFHPDPQARSGLRYEPSGREPHLVVASGRGYPYIPKSEYHALPPAANLSRLRAAIAALPAGGEVDFSADLAPALVRDAYAQYYRTQARVAGEMLRVDLEEIERRIDAAQLHHSSFAGLGEQLRDALDGVSAEPLDLGAWMDPLATFAGGSAAQLTEFIAQGLARDIDAAVAAADSALKAALWEISAARKPVSIAGSEGRMTWESRNGAYREFMAFGQMVGSGPPLFRTRQLLALVDAGLVSFLGAHPQLRAHPEDGEFAMHSAVGEVRSPWLIDAWMHSPDVRQPADPLAVSLAQRVRPFVDHGHPTGSPETTWERLVVHPDGSVDTRLHIVGIPTYAQWPDTTISPMPGTDPLMLQETDRTAASLLRCAGIPTAAD